MGTIVLAKKRRQTIITWSIIGGSLTLIVIFGFFIVLPIYTAIKDDENTLRFLSNSLYGYGLTDIVGSPQETTIGQYDYSLIYNIVGARANLFPQTIENGSTEYFEFHERVKYNYYDRYEIYLEWAMPQERFDQEVERISKISSSTKTIKLSNDLFGLPSYVAVYNNSRSEYEYAIIDSDNYTIRYIEFENVGSIEQIVFSHDYAPQKLLKNSDLARFSRLTGHYDIYD